MCLSMIYILSSRVQSIHIYKCMVISFKWFSVADYKFIIVYYIVFVLTIKIKSYP